jgi:hypothetical protein
VAFGDLTDTLAMLTVSLDGEVIQDQRISTDVLSFKPGAPDAGAHPLDDQAAFQLGDGADDHDDGSAQRSSGIDALPEADELVVLRLAGQHITSRSDAEAVASGERCA